MTQEFLEVVLGVHRSSLTSAARKLEADGLIEYRRGQLTILGRQRRERRACECYAVSKRELRFRAGAQKFTRFVMPNDRCDAPATARSHAPCGGR